jgi:hypothetical protein
VAAPAAVADPVVMAAGDIACASPGITSPGDCSHPYTANLLVAQRDSAEGLAAALAMGDLQYDRGSLSEFCRFFGPTWGRLGSLLRPVPGNHEYATSGAAGYFDYFRGLGVPTGARGQGWYSFDIGACHRVALNSSNGCSPVACTAGSPQEAWLPTSPPRGSRASSPTGAIRLRTSCPPAAPSGPTSTTPAPTSCSPGTTTPTAGPAPSAPTAGRTAAARASSSSARGARAAASTAC